MSNDQEQVRVDLDDLLAVLDRDQLEHLIVKCIIKDQEVFSLLDEATTILDQQNLLDSLEPLEDAPSIQELLIAVEPFRKRFEGYCKLKLYKNALIVLYALSNQLLIKLIETGLDPKDELCTNTIIQLEQHWRVICTNYDPPAGETQPTAPSSTASTKSTTASTKPARFIADDGSVTEDVDDLELVQLIDAPTSFMDIFGVLARWREQIKVMGPIFDDSLRILKQRVLDRRAQDEKASNTPSPAVAAAPKKTSFPSISGAVSAINASSAAPVAAKKTSKPTGAPAAPQKRPAARAKAPTNAKKIKK